MQKKIVLAYLIVSVCVAFAQTGKISGTVIDSQNGEGLIGANVSHELRTPLTSIQRFSEALNDGALEDKENTRRFVDIIHRQADRMGNILEDILTLSRLDRGDDLTDIEFKESGILDVVAFAVE